MDASRDTPHLLALSADALDPGVSADALLAPWLSQSLAGGTRVGAGGGEGVLYRGDEARSREAAARIGDRFWLRVEPLACLRGDLASSHVGGALHQLLIARDRGYAVVVANQSTLGPALAYLEETGLCALRSRDAGSHAHALAVVAPGDRSRGDDLQGPLAELERLGARDVAHLGINLHDHLVNTFGLLREFDNPETVCLAGLYHAAYGTAGFAQALFDPSDRTVLSDLIGAAAESLVYHYCANDREYAETAALRGDSRGFRDRFTGTRKTLPVSLACGLWELTLANELEIGIRDEAFRARHRAEFTHLFTAVAAHLSRPAQARFRFVFR